MGTPFVAVPILEMLIENTNVVLVVTKPDKEVGRKRKLQASPVKEVAIKNNIPVFQPVKVKNDFQIIKDLKPDLIITCAFGEIISEDILNIPKKGALNIHASLLPKYRGASPIQGALLNGEKETGVTLMYMDKGMDTGDIIDSKSFPITINDNVETLHDKVSKVGQELLLKNLPNIINGTNKRYKQDDNKATYTKIIKREDELLDFNNNCIDVFNKIRAFSPWPLSYFILDGLEIKVIKAEYEIKKNTKPGIISVLNKHSFGIDCKCGTIYLQRVKPFGKKEMDITSFINGIKDKNIIGKKVN